MIIQVIIPPIPAELIVISAGKLYGQLITTIVAGTGLYIGSILVYFIGKYIHKKFQKFFKKEKVKKAIKQIRKFESLILWIRILPYNPSDIISYAAGIIKVKTKKFLTISLFTSYIRCYILAVLGSYLINIRTLLQVSVVLITSAIFTYFIVFRKK